MIPTEEWFKSLAGMLESAGSPMSPAELHGGLCGVLCSSGPDGASVWFEHCVDACPAPATLEDLRALFDGLKADSWRALMGTEMEFGPVLPDDDAVLDERVRALALWCGGFVTGLGLGGLTLEQAHGCDAEVLEIVRDFIEISKADSDLTDSESRETAEAAFTEVAEFVRVGVQIVFESLVRRAQDGATIH